MDFSNTLCVERGRWTRRGDEDAAAFSVNNQVLSSRELKMAARYGLSQSDVWSGVAEQQAKLNDNVSRLTGKRVDTRSPVSASSLPLTLENKELAAVRQQYLQALSRIVESRTDVIGFAYAINGEVNSAEVYNNKLLFRALWPKLLDAAVTEAIRECTSDLQPPAVDAAQIKAFFETAVSGTPSERLVWKTTRLRTYTTPTALLFEAVDLDAGDRWIHKSFIRRTQDTVVVPLDPEPRRFGLPPSPARPRRCNP